MDLWTLYIAIAVTGLCLGGVELAAYATGRFGRWPLWWGAANLLIALGGICVAMQWAVPIADTVMLGNLLLVVGHLLLVGGVRDFAGSRLPVWVLGVALSACVVAVCLRSSDEFVLRAASLSVAAALFDFAIILEAVRLARRERLRSAWIMMALFSISAAMHAFRGVFLAEGTFGHETLFGTGSGAHAVLGVPATGILALRGMILLLLAAERNKVHLEGLAYRDPLTGALTRLGLRNAKEILLHGAPRASLRASVLLIDVDRFKQINDSQGHDVGDAVLCVVAEAARNVLPKHGFVARWWGDEFVVLLPGTAVEDALAVAEALRRRVRAHAVPSAPVTLSIGIATGCLRVGSLGDLLKQADKALYEVKRAGRNGVRLVEPVPQPKGEGTGACQS